MLSPCGRDAVHQLYTAFVASGAVKLELDAQRLLVDEDLVMTEGVMQIAYPGALLRLLGHAVDDPEASYLFEADRSFSALGIVLPPVQSVVVDSGLAIVVRAMRCPSLVRVAPLDPH